MSTDLTIPADVIDDVRESLFCLLGGGYLPILEDQEAEADLDDQRRAAERKPARKGEIVKRLIAFRALAALLQERIADMGD